MKFSFIAVLALTGTFIGAACSAASDTASHTNVAANSNSGTSVPVNSGDYVGGAQPADANANAAPGDNTAPPMSAAQAKIEAMRKSGVGGQDFGDVEAMALKTGRPAPDNSIYASYLTDAGYEVRSFKDHPQILKVVKRSDGENQTLKVYLRNGKVVDVPVQSITPLATASVSVILEAAGIKPPPPATPAGPPIPGKKGGEN